MNGIKSCDSATFSLDVINRIVLMDSGKMSVVPVVSMASLISRGMFDSSDVSRKRNQKNVFVG